MFRNRSRKCVTCTAIKSREQRLRRVFGISIAEYDAIFAVQGGVCAICRRGPEALLDFGVDHDHRTGKVRGILCTQCNYYFLGRFDDIARLEAAAEYLRHPPAGAVLLRCWEDAGMPLYEKERSS